MAAIDRHALATALTAICIVGCATTSMSTDHWTYSGRDEALRMPPRVPRGELSPSAWLARLKENEAAWWQQREALVESAKDSCARETGQSKTPGYWFGFGNAFEACMKARGWTVGRSPL